MVTHEADVARHAGRIVTVRDGRVRADDSVPVPARAAGALAALPAEVA